LLTGILLIAPLAKLAVSATSEQPILTGLTALAACGLVVLLLHAILSAATTHDSRLRSTAPCAADHSTDSRPQSTSAGVKPGPTPGQPASRLHEIASAIKTVAIISAVVVSVVTLRTIVALEVLH
jgi:hypothetical protein